MKFLHHTKEGWNMRTDLSYLFYILLGYLSGSILFGYEIPKIWKGIDIREDAEDGNPGTFNAFVCGGIGCGIFTLLADLLKGIIPVAMCRNKLGMASLWFMFVMAAPVLGHAFSVFHHYHGGKAIAVSFGVLIGLLPFYRPLLLLIICYLLFSLLLPIKSHAKRSMIAYLCFAAVSLFWVKEKAVLYGILFICAVVVYKHYMAQTAKERQEESRRKWRME